MTDASGKNAWALRGQIRVSPGALIPTMNPRQPSVPTQPRLIKTFAICWLVASVCAATVSAQPMASPVRAPAEIAVDTGSAEEGGQAGKTAGGKRSVTDRFAMAFLGGLPIGLLGVALEDPVGFIALGVGVVTIDAAWKAGSVAPSPHEIRTDRGEAYRRAYRESYGKRLRERRGKAAMLGGLVGTVTGFGLLFVLLSGSGT